MYMQALLFITMSAFPIHARSIHYQETMSGITFFPSRFDLPQQQQDDAPRRKGWYPPALHWWVLVPTALICWTTIAILQYYLHRSQIDGEVIYAPSVNQLPLRQSFVFLYMPTIVAVTFSIFIVWLDHDAKRFEPHRYLLKAGGALGKDSLLLHCPFDFVPFVPFTAARRRPVLENFDTKATADALRHWLVF